MGVFSQQLLKNIMPQVSKAIKEEMVKGLKEIEEENKRSFGVKIEDWLENMKGWIVSTIEKEVEKEVTKKFKEYEGEIQGFKVEGVHDGEK